MDFYTTAILQGLGFAGLGLGIFLTLKIFNIPDITTDGSYTLGGAVTAIMLVNGFSPYITLLTAICSGMIAGFTTGIIHTKLKVNALLAGILVMTALYSINLSIMGRSNIPLIQTPTIFSEIIFFVNEFSNKIILFSIFSLVLILFITWLLKTDFGIAMRATGNSESMVRASGVDTQRMKIIGLALANGLTALSGFLITQYQGFADINMGIGIVISGLGAVIIGESLIKLFRNNKLFAQILGVIIGTVLFRLILAVALDLGLNPNYLKLITAVIVLLVVSLTRFVKEENK
ncbi:MAG TPA: ABC transporter permease [Bacteroidia bacterium]|nr:ABC transporter permease [Bacteroidia bacterium]